MSLLKSLFLATPLALFGGLAVADDVRLPPSVGATPIEIPYIDPDAPLTLDRQSLDQSGTRVRPLDGGASVMVMPVPIPGDGIERIDPTRIPGAFSVLPIPLTDPERVAMQGPFTYAVLRDGSIYGDTNFGYARFQDLTTYRAFLRGH
ncbi:hypothetical protein [Salibaculum sp.]|uniref:hypothetical protein n=1 Tax=Salibaculum sp. TaxID=2855480 RepID=UPI002B45F641|nr:hypothetical protein [Salibaculum sp.]HKL69975.1 hypothetical protein [Salibaculum sp.]